MAGDVAGRFGATSRSWCRQCARIQTFRWVGVEAHLEEKDAETWACVACGHVRLQLADLPDADGLCRAVLDRKLRQNGSHVEYEDALQLMRTELWDRFVAWQPRRGIRFTPYATGLLRLRVANWYRDHLGRDVPKPLSIAVSLDAPGGEDEDGPGLGSAIGDWSGDPASHRDPDLLRVLTP